MYDLRDWYHCFYGPAYQCLPQFKPPVFLSGPHIVPAPTDALLPPQHSRPAYIPILPQPSVSGSTIPSSSITTTVTSSNNTINTSSNDNNLLTANDEHVTAALGVPTSMLSPAPSEKCPSDSDSCHNDTSRSPQNSDHDIDPEERLDMKYDATGMGDDGVCRLLWEFIYQLLQDTKYQGLVCWESAGDLMFRINNPMSLAELWGMQKNRTNMTYEKLSRALRYYYKMNIIKKVPGKRLTYQFLQHPTKIRKGQRGARPHASRMMAAEMSEEVTEGSGTLDPSAYPTSRTSSLSSSSSTMTMHSSDFAMDVESPKQPQISDGSPGDMKAVPPDPEGGSAHLETPGNMSQQVWVQHYIKDRSDLNCQPNVNGKMTNGFPGADSETFSSRSFHCDDVMKSCTLEKDIHSTNPTLTYNSVDPHIRKGSPHQHCAPQAHFMDAMSTQPLLLQNRSLSNSLLPTNSSAYFHSERNRHSPTVFNERPPMLNAYDRSFPHHRSANDLSLNTDNNMKRSSSASPSYLTSQSPTSSLIEALKSPGHHKLYRPYPRFSPRHNLHSQSPSPPGEDSPRHSHSMYDPAQQVESHHSRQNLYTRSPQRHYDLVDEPHHYSSSFPHRNQGPSQLSRSDLVSRKVKYEMSPGEQDEPEDLSMKARSEKSSTTAEIKSELENSQGSEGKDAMRDSPQSCSPDSAYGSDKSEFMKDNGAEDLPEILKNHSH